MEVVADQWFFASWQLIPAAIVSRETSGFAQPMIEAGKEL
jgi:hypothetical protein